jgi:hypothetical protein
VIFFCALVIAYWLIRHQEFTKRWMEDLPVYTRALAAWQSGRDPYSTPMMGLYFLYPPFFLYAAGILSWAVPAHWGGGLYAALHVAATCALPLVLARYFFRQTWLSLLFALLLFFASPFFTGMLALCGGNIASTLYCLAFLAAVPGLRRNQWIWFYIAVFLAAMVKIPFLELLLLPVLTGKRQWLRSILCGVAVVGAYLLEMKALPDLYSQFRWSLAHGIVAMGSYGYGVFGAFATYGHWLHIPSPSGAYVVVVALDIALVALMLLMRRRLESLGETNPIADLSRNGIWLALVVTTVILMNPRQMNYDVDISLVAAYVLWVYGLRTQRFLLLMVALFVPSLFVPLFLGLQLQGTYPTITILAAFGLAYWRLWRETEQASEAQGVSTRGDELNNEVGLSAVPGS